MAVIEAIATTYLEADAASVTFSSIPSTYEHLQLRASPKDNGLGNYSVCYMNFNNDTGTNYTHHFIYAYSATTAAIPDVSMTTARAYGMAASDTSPSVDEATFGGVVIDILDYTNTNKYTTWRYGAGAGVDFSGSIPYFIAFGGGVWLNTAALSTLKVAGEASTLRRGSEFTLYGLKSS